MVLVRKLKHYAITNIIADILIVAPLVYIMSYEVNMMKVCRSELVLVAKGNHHKGNVYIDCACTFGDAQSSARGVCYTGTRP